jgi:ribosome-associated protein
MLNFKSVPSSACEFRFIHSSGPGGQHVNKTATAVELRVDIALLSLSAYAWHRLHKQQAKRISKEGILVVQASSHRSQLKNRQEALDRVNDFIKEAKARAKTRIATQPTLSSKRKRVDQKKKHASIKRQRQRPDWER